MNNKVLYGLIVLLIIIIFALHFDKKKSESELRSFLEQKVQQNEQLYLDKLKDIDSILKQNAVFADTITIYEKQRPIIYNNYVEKANSIFLNDSTERKRQYTTDFRRAIEIIRSGQLFDSIPK